MPLLAGADSATPPATPTAVEPADRAAPRATRPTPARLGEELPIFCERCGYSLHGLPQARCERCTVLHYACPECNHHQPINTLRPVAQRLLGRIRAFALGFWVLVKLNYFGWLLVGWFAMGNELSYQRHWSSPPIVNMQSSTRPPRPVVNIVPPTLDPEFVLPVILFALPFAMVGRMLLLRWRRGWAVGLVLAALVAAALLAGGFARQFDLGRWAGVSVPPMPDTFVVLVAVAAAAVVAGSASVWGAWLAVVHLLLPARTAKALLDWQRGLSSRDALPREPALARE